MGENLIGKNIAGFEILEQLAEGGMAQVYKARDIHLKRYVAIKFLRAEWLESQKALKRFEIESKALAKLNHPNIVQVLDFGEYEGTPYLVMEYISGGTLKEKIGEPIPWQHAAVLLAPIADALEYAHRQNMIHRDVKPSNILIDADGTPKLADFGVAKLQVSEETLDLTGTSVGVGTPWYMAPEQGTGEPVDHRADVYALGVVFYELITGRKPFQADDPIALLFQHTNELIPRPRKLVPGLPIQVEGVMYKALEKDPNNRFRVMSEFAIKLEQLSQGRKLGLVIHRGIKRNLMVIAFLLVITGIVSVLWVSLPSEHPIHSLSLLFSSMTPSPSPTPTAQLTRTETLIPSPSPTATYTPTLSQTATLTPTRTNTPPPTLGIGSARISPVDGMVMLYVPEGEFIMGSDNLKEDEGPVHTVYLDAFWIDKTEVTNAIFLKCVEAGNCIDISHINCSEKDETNYYLQPTVRRLHSANYSEYPVVCVSWANAKAYCEWGSRRLPTEAEWEKAARGTDGRKYPWGEGIDCQKANTKGCVGDSVPVGSYPIGASPYGALDMSGNVWEWVADYYDSEYYIESPYENPLGAVRDESEFYFRFAERVIRGASYLFSGDIEASTTEREGRQENAINNSSLTGFRCASDVEP